MKTKILTLPLLLLLFSIDVAAQLDTKHWIPPFFAKVESNSGISDIKKHFVSLSTPAEDTIPVIIRDGFGALIDTVFISKAMPAEYIFGPEGFAAGPDTSGVDTLSIYPLNVIPRDSLNIPIRSQGLYFESFQPFFVNMRHKSVSQGFSLTSKGQVGLGTKFFSGHIYTTRNATGNADEWNNERRSHFISVMATEDNTEVTIDMIKDPILFIGQTTQGEPITVTLDAFESYVVGVDHNNLSNEDINKVNGTRITSDKPIVCNSGSWLSGNQAGQCIGADQLVTADVTGQEYILVRGLGDETTERPMVVAIEDGTEVFLNDETIPIAILDEGEFHFIDTEKFTDNGNLYILATEKVFVFQTISGSNESIGPTVGLNFIPPLNCVGAKEVNLPFVNSLASGGDGTLGGRINIITKLGTAVFVNESVTPLTGASTVTGNSEWVSYAFDAPTVNVNIVSDSVMNVALLTRDNNVGSAGYFSGFTLEPVVGLSAGISGTTPCIPGNAVLQVFGFDTYQWFFEGEEIEGATGNTLTPEFAGQYSVEGIDIACGFRFPSNPFVIPYCPSTLGAAKEAQVVQETAPGSRIFDLTYQIFIENLAGNVSQNIQVIENIQGGLPAGATAELIGTPNLSFGNLTGGLNASFDGVTNRRLLPGNGNLPGAGAGNNADAIGITIRVDMNAAEQDGFFNQVTVSSIDEGINDGVTGPFNGQDFSHVGTNPDPNGNGEPNEEGENERTLTCFFPNTFEYLAESFCISDDIQAIELDGVSSGLFTTAIDGLAIDAETGVITPQDSDAGTYIVTFTVAGRCPSTTTTEVTIIPIPVPGVGSTLEVCEQSELVDLNDVLQGEDLDGIWTDSEGTEVGNTFDPVSPGSNVFTYTVINEPCPAESADVTVNVITAPVSGVPAENTAFCFDQSQVSLDELIVAADADGVWTDANGIVIEDSYIFEGSGDFTLTYTTTNAICGDRSTDVVVSVIPVPDAGEDVGLETFCEGEEVNLNDLLIAADDDGQWFDPEGVESADVIDLSVLGSQVYTYTINRVPCPEVSEEVTFEVVEGTTPGVPTDGQNNLCSDDESNVNLFNYLVGSDLDGVWTDGDGIVVTNSFVPSVEGDYEFTYTVSSMECGDVSATIIINVSEGNCEVLVELDIPEGFSPNGDGMNDEFEIQGLNELYPNNSLQIFNRWGAEVLAASPYNNDWNGKAETGLNAGEQLPVGTYWYILDLGNGADPIMDFVYLNR
ncbi:MAG: gliding motility-associated-like protein [Cryomorphaceae bacterium]|jgi:gliding motility-associated-like protein